MSSNATNSDEVFLFSQRLNEICDDKGLPLHGRQAELGRLFGVSSNGARKWLQGKGMPELAMCIRIAKWADVNLEWLCTNRGPKRALAVDMSAIALSEAMDYLPPPDRHELLGFFKYKLEKQSSKTSAGERVARYIKAVELRDK